MCKGGWGIDRCEFFRAVSGLRDRPPPQLIYKYVRSCGAGSVLQVKTKLSPQVRPLQVPVTLFVGFLA